MEALTLVCVWLNDQKRASTIHVALCCKQFSFHLSNIRWSYANVLLSNFEFFQTVRIDKGRIAEFAAKYGRLDLLQYARRCKFKFDNMMVIQNASRYGHLEILQYARTISPTYIGVGYLNSALVRGHMDVVKYWLDHGVQMNSSTAASVAEVGDFELLKSLCEEHNLILDDFSVISGAARSGNIEILEWLVQHGCQIDIDLSLSAAYTGRTNVLEWLIQNGHPIHPDIGYHAVWGKQIDFLKFALSRHLVNWSPAFCTIAASKGYLNLLKRLREQGCPWNEDTCLSAVRYGQLKILQWAIQNGCPAESALSLAINLRYWRISRWLIQQGFPISQKQWEKVRAHITIDIHSVKFID